LYTEVSVIGLSSFLLVSLFSIKTWRRHGKTLSFLVFNWSLEQNTNGREFREIFIRIYIYWLWFCLFAALLSFTIPSGGDDSAEDSQNSDPQWLFAQSSEVGELLFHEDPTGGSDLVATLVLHGT